MIVAEICTLGYAVDNPKFYLVVFKKICIFNKVKLEY
jgi:hypothetical protein